MNENQVCWIRSISPAAADAPRSAVYQRMCCRNGRRCLGLQWAMVSCGSRTAYGTNTIFPMCKDCSKRRCASGA